MNHDAMEGGGRTGHLYGPIERSIGLRFPAQTAGFLPTPRSAHAQSGRRHYLRRSLARLSERPNNVPRPLLERRPTYRNATCRIS